jgi:hypothetical protein
MSWDKKKTEGETKAEPKPETKVEGSTVRELVQEMMPAMAALISNAQQPQRPVGNPLQMKASLIAQANSEAALSAEKCHVCGQKKHACKDEHTEMVVWPERYPEFGRNFQGVTINCVTYSSSHPGHVISVPKHLADFILTEVQRYERTEREARIGRDMTVWATDPKKARIAESMGLL